MRTSTEMIETKLANGVSLHIEATVLGGEEKVAAKISSFDNVTDIIEGIADSVVTTLKKVKPQKASIEFGLEVALEAGQLTALLVKGSSTAHLQVTLEWNESSPE